MARQTKEAKLEKAIEAIVSEIYRKNCANIQINIMDIGEVMKVGVEAFNAPETDAACLVGFADGKGAADLLDLKLERVRKAIVDYVHERLKTMWIRHWVLLERSKRFGKGQGGVAPFFRSWIL